MDRRAALPWMLRLQASHRLTFAVVAAMGTLLLTWQWMAAGTRMLLSWDIGASVYLGFAWAVVARADAAMTRARVRTQDQSGYVIFLLVVSASLMSIVAIGFLVANIKELPFWPRAWHLTLSILALASSWLLIHTLFGFHYAQRYYAHRRDPQAEPRGLHFPGGENLDYLDFAYYAFVVGMTSQVSDVSVTAQHMRRLTLIHGVLSFIFNIAILAMSINIIGGVL